MNHAHLASAIVDAPAAYVFAHLADGTKLGRWALGSMNMAPQDEPGLWKGTSLFDGQTTEVEIRPHPDLGLIDYDVGDRGSRVPRVSVRVTEGAQWGLPASSSLVTLTTWRAAWMDDERWRRTEKTHEVEILLLKAQIEADHRAG